MRTRPRDSKPPRKPLPAVAQLGPFTHDQVAAIRKHKTTGCLITAGQRPPKPDSVRPLKYIAAVLDGDGNPTGETTTVASSIPLTVRAVSRKLDITEINDDHARTCGYATAAALRGAWLTKHPRTQVVRVVRFDTGDTRDLQMMMQRGGGETLSPARALDPDAPKVPAEYQDELTRRSHARAQKNRAKDLEAKAARSLAIRVKDAQKRQDPDEIARIRAELADLEHEMRAAA